MAIQSQSDILIAGISNVNHFKYGLGEQNDVLCNSGKPIVFSGDEKPPIIHDIA